MAVYSIQRVQNIPAPLPAVWDFFASPANLATITPPSMDFKVISAFESGKIYPGQLIEYKIRPVMGIPLYWMTEITQVEEGRLFVDEQRKGPYRLWRHQHHFKAIPGGVEMTDMVQYQNPLWWIGDIANRIFVRRKLEQIFDFRFNKTAEIFGKWKAEKQLK